MSDTSAEDQDANVGADDGAEALDEVREAATAVISSLRSFLVAAEKVVSDPSAFNQVVSGGKGLFDAFTSGFSDESSPSDKTATDI